MKKIIAIDDLAYFRSQAEIEAENEFRFSWGGTDYVLDLADPNYADVTKFFTELAAAATVLRVKAKTGLGRAGPGTSNGGRSTSENAKLRTWVKKNNIMAREGRPRLGYLTEQGKHRYPDWLWDLYDAREEADGLGSDRPDRRPADAGNRGGKG